MTALALASAPTATKGGGDRGPAELVADVDLQAPARRAGSVLPLLFAEVIETLVEGSAQ